MWHCQTHCGGGDTVELVAVLEGGDYGSAARTLAEIEGGVTPATRRRDLPAPRTATPRAFSPYTKSLRLELEQYLQGLLAGGPEAIALCKRMLRAVSELSLEQAGPHTAELIARMRTGAEAQEGMRAFLEHRTPRWRK